MSAPVGGFGGRGDDGGRSVMSAQFGAAPGQFGPGRHRFTSRDSIGSIDSERGRGGKRKKKKQKKKY